MRRIILLLVAAGLPVWAATTISDTIYAPTGELWTGNIVLECPSGVDAAGRTIRAMQRTFQIRAGAFSAAVDAGDAGAPARRACTVTYFPRTGKNWVETWLVPTSATPVKISDCQTGPIPTPPAQLQASQVRPGTNGQYLCTAGSTSAWCSPPSGGGGAGSTWDDLMAITWDELR